MQNTIVIRDIRPEDYPDLTELLGELGYPSALESVTKRLNIIEADGSYKTYAAEVNGNVAGMIGLHKSLAYEGDGCYVRIVALVVRESFRNQGIGSKLIDAAEQWVIDAGASGMALCSGIKRENAHWFYRSRGFSQTEYGFTKKV